MCFHCEERLGAHRESWDYPTEHLLGSTSLSSPKNRCAQDSAYVIMTAGKDHVMLDQEDNFQVLAQIRNHA